MTYKPIERHGVIGDMRTAALVNEDGSVVWWCCPRFDSPSVFASLLDDDKGGMCQIAPADGEMSAMQFYVPSTNVLVTRFHVDAGIVELHDFMPVGDAATDSRCIIRRVMGVKGRVPMRMVCQPAFDYARAEHEIKQINGGVRFIGKNHAGALELTTDCTLNDAGDCDFEIAEGQTAAFVLRYLDPDKGESPDESVSTPADASTRMDQTIDYWRRWLSHCTYTGRWREDVYRSALTLKMMTYEPTGAIVAAITTSLPEAVGGERNWDYRFTWIRDSAFTMYAFLRIGFREEAEAFMRFLEGVCQRTTESQYPMQPIYGINGHTDLNEQTLDHLDGYRGSKPVRIGNAAHQHLQLDIYGELMDAAYLFNKWGEPISIETWSLLERFVNWVCDHWDQDDEGIWEVRGGRQRFTFSAMMCWVAVDRGIRLARKRSFPGDHGRWRNTRDEIYRAIVDRGYNEDRGAFTLTMDGSDELDASCLMMPLVFFMSPTDPKMLSTLDTILKPVDSGGLSLGGLIYRYDPAATPDSLQGHEGTFNICTLWMVEALTRAGQFHADRLDRARNIFERLHKSVGPLGLFAEQIGPCGESIGNYPQAFTHLSFISAAYNLDRSIKGG